MSYVSLRSKILFDCLSTKSLAHLIIQSWWEASWNPPTPPRLSPSLRGTTWVMVQWAPVTMTPDLWGEVSHHIIYTCALMGLSRLHPVTPGCRPLEALVTYPRWSQWWGHTYHTTSSWPQWRCMCLSQHTHWSQCILGPRGWYTPIHTGATRALVSW